MYIQHAQAFFVQRGHGQNGPQRHFNSHGKGFAPAGCYNSCRVYIPRLHHSLTWIYRVHAIYS